MKFSESLKKSKDFQKVYVSGKSYANRHLIMYVLKNGTNTNRLGISVSKKVGNSVVRHHLTRLVKESYRLNEEKFVSGNDMIVVIRVNAGKIGFHEMEASLLHIGKIHKILTEEWKNKDGSLIYDENVMFSNDKIL